MIWPQSVRIHVASHLDLDPVPRRHLRSCEARQHVQQREKAIKGRQVKNHDHVTPTGWKMLGVPRHFCAYILLALAL